jgi:hypothetical protein
MTSSCQCLQDDEQSDPTHTTEQFCGYRKSGVTYACSKAGACGNQCTDSKKCNNGCPVLNQPAAKQSDSGQVVAKKKKPKKPSKPSSTDSKSSTSKWWLWPLVTVVSVLLVSILVFLFRS